MDQFWTEEKVNTLIEMINGGHTHREISITLGATKNQVIGKASRLKLTYKASIRPKFYIIKETASKKIKIPKKYFVRALPAPRHDMTSEPPSLRKTILSLEDFECRYPHGDPKEEDFHFCGHPTLMGSSYCEFHHNLCQKIYKPKKQKLKKHLEHLEINS